MENLVTKGLEALTTAGNIVVGQLPELGNELLNYIIFTSVLSILASLVWGIIPIFVTKMLNGHISNLDHVQATEKMDDDNRVRLRNQLTFFKALRGTIVLASVLIGFNYNQPSVHRLAKILIAPKLFLIQEGAEFIKGLKK